MQIEIVGFGLAGACLAIELVKRGVEVRVCDNGVPGSTVVAAGLVNPVAGKNFQPSWRVKEFWAEALAFYDELDGGLFHSALIHRKWMNDREKFEKKRELVGPWIEKVDESGVTWGKGGWLDARRFLEVARKWLLEKGVFFERDRSGELLSFYCTGSKGLRAGEFDGVAHRCAKGEILTVDIPEWEEERILTGGGWLIPIGGGRFRIGATYAWDELDVGPTEEGRESVEKILRSFTPRNFRVVDHVAGVRPIIRRSQPMAHFQDGKGWMINGLGSKGVIYAPGVARRLAEHVLDGVALDPAFSL